MSNPPPSTHLTASDLDYLRLQYLEGSNIIRYWIDCRYKMLQFVGAYNGAILAFGAILFSLPSGVREYWTHDGKIYGVSILIFICVVSILIAAMGLATEFSTSSYVYRYFAVMREIEERLNFQDPKGPLLYKVGIATYGQTLEHNITNRDQKFHALLPVHRAHKLFYSILAVLWCGSFILVALWLMCNLNFLGEQFCRFFPLG
jgi:hypothetical protein